MLSIISLFILRDNIIFFNKNKDKNNDKNKLSGSNVDVDGINLEKNKVKGGKEGSITDPFPLMEKLTKKRECWFSFFEISGCVYGLFLYIFIFTTILDSFADNIYWGALIV